MKSAYIYHHLGLGDHIIANGIVRTLYKQYDKIYLFCKSHNYKNVSYMYSDLLNLKIIIMDDNEVRSFMQFNPNNHYINIGHEPFWEIFRSNNNTLKIDEIFYKLANVPLQNKWKEFYIKRNLEKEKQIYTELVGNSQKFIFVHDTDKRKITRLPENENIKIIRPDNHDFSLFDYLYTIEQANEIHVINSSFFCLIDCIGINNENMYLHTYARTDIDDKSTPILGGKWKIIE